MRADAPVSTARETALGRIEHWRARSAHPLTTPELQEVCEIVARSYEGLYMQAVASADQ
jgi:hypothetical protein